jgi:thioesterase domain-containing protein
VIDRLAYRIRSDRRLPRFIRRIASGGWINKTGKTTADRRIRQLQSSLDAINRYCVKSYQGKMVVFRVKQSHARMHFDAWAGWGKVAMGGIEVLEIPGHHMNLLEEPHVEVLAEKMRGCLMEAHVAATPLDASPAN